MLSHYNYTPFRTYALISTSIVIAIANIFRGRSLELKYLGYIINTDL